MPRRTHILHASVLVMATAATVVGNAFASLEENQVLLLYNSQNPVSAAIAEEYLELHPDVRTFDLDIEYPETVAQIPNPNCDGCLPPGNPEPCDTSCDCGACGAEAECCLCRNVVDGESISEFFVTPGYYEEHIRQPLLALFDPDSPEYETYESVIAIVTTRGLPAVVSKSFTPLPSHALHCIKVGFESALSRLGYAHTPGGTYFVNNPYLGTLGQSFNDFLDDATDACGPGGLGHRHKMFLVSRLDAGDADGDEDYVEDVCALINRSVNLVVNKFGTTMVFDFLPGDANGEALPGQRVAQKVVENRWCVYFDMTWHFLHGAYQPSPPPSCGGLDAWSQTAEGNYVSYPELVHVTRGRRHRDANSEPICVDYIRHYNAHPAGLFLSNESYNGTGLWNPPYPGAPTGNDGWMQGSVLDWLSAGGSFTVGYVVGPGYIASIDQTIHENIVYNLYHHGLSWGEAVYSGIVRLGQVQTPIGDPLASVHVVDPDVNHDGMVEETDIELVEAAFGPCSCPEDLNGDGVVNEDDVDLVEEVFGRDCSSDPNIPAMGYAWPAIALNSCGDFDENGLIDSTDLDAVTDALGRTDCARLDFDFDGEVTSADVAIVQANLNRCRPDVTGDGNLDIDDIVQMISNIGKCKGDANWNSATDMNCDGCTSQWDFDYYMFSTWHPSIVCP